MSTLFRWIGNVGPDWDSMSGTITNWLNISAGTHTIVPTADTGDVAVFDDGGIHTVGGGGSADEFTIEQDTSVTLTGAPFEAGAYNASDNADFPYDLIVSDGGKLVVASGAELQSQGTLDVIGETDLFGGSGSGSLEVDPGAAYGTQGLILGDNTGGNGVVTISDAAEFSVVAPALDASGDGELIIGYSGTGSLDITDTPYAFTESAVLGLNQGAVGSLSLDNTTWGGGDVTIGAAGTGHATIGAGANVALHNFVVGSAEGASGDLTVTGANDFISDFLTIGVDGTGTATFGADSNAMIGAVTVGESADAVANLTLDGATWNADSLTIGLFGTGQATAGEGEIITVGGVILSSDADASGDLSVDDAVLNGGTVVIGQDGTGDLEIGSGSSGSVSAVVVGEDQDSDGMLTVGGNADWNIGSLTVGLGGSGQATVETGATATVGTVLIGPNGNLAVTETSGSEGMVIAQRVTIDFGTLDVSGFGRVLVGATAGVNGAVAIGSNSSLTGLGSLEGDVVLSDGGLVKATAAVPGALTIDGNVHGTGTIEPLISLEVNGGIDAGVTIAFGPSIGAQVGDLILDVPAANLGTIVGFGVGNTIVVEGSLYSDAVFTQGTSGAAGTLTLSGDTLAPLSFAVEGTYAADSFIATPNLTETDVTLCFAAGTRIATERGEVAVEAIGIGDMVRVLLGEGSAGDGFSEVIWVGRREVECAGHGQPRKVWPVRVAAGAFGPGRPHSELFLSPNHAVFVNDVLIPIRHLINGSSIVQVKVEWVTYHHIELAEHDVLLAEGLPAESFLDVRDGSNYANRSRPARLYPDYSARMWEAFGCARLVITGPQLKAARALVAGFARARGTAGRTRAGTDSARAGRGGAPGPAVAGQAAAPAGRCG